LVHLGVTQNWSRTWLLSQLSFLSAKKTLNYHPLWTTARTGRVVNKSLSEAMRTKFWGEFEVFKASSYDTWVARDTITPSDTWEQVFDKHFSSQRFSFLLMFLKKELGIMRNMGVGISSKKPKPEQKVKLVNQNEKWLCPCCSTFHRNDKKPVRPYLSACEVWKQMNIEKQIQACKQHRYCTVCTSSLDTKYSVLYLKLP
jgi:hypothetical protein